MTELSYYDSADSFVKHLKELADSRESNKKKEKRGKPLSHAQRVEVLKKTDYQCHICGCILSEDNFEADHVKSHASGGQNMVENYLPSCKTCNNYRWDYSPEEMKWILKIGIWIKTHMINKSRLGKIVAEAFIQHEIKREKRRKNPRSAC